MTPRVARAVLWSAAGVAMLLLGLLGPPTAMGSAHQPPGIGTESEQIRARLVANRSAVAPGETVLLGIVFDVAPGWHVYWDGANDSGAPLGVTPTLPAGYTAGALRWPVPARHVVEDQLLDHIYEGRVTLVLPVTAPADARPGTTADLRAALDWFVCKDVCLRGEGSVSLALPVVARGEAAAAQPSPDASLFELLFPKPAPEWLKSSWDNGRLTLSAAGSRGGPPAKIAFYPARDSALPDNLIERGEAAGDTLRLDIKPPAAGKPPARVRGIVHLMRSDRSKDEAYTVDLPVPTGAGS